MARNRLRLPKDFGVANRSRSPGSRPEAAAGEPGIDRDISFLSADFDALFELAKQRESEDSVRRSPSYNLSDSIPHSPVRSFHPHDLEPPRSRTQSLGSNLKAYSGYRGKQSSRSQTIEGKHPTYQKNPQQSSSRTQAHSLSAAQPGGGYSHGDLRHASGQERSRKERDDRKKRLSESLTLWGRQEQNESSDTDDEMSVSSLESRHNRSFHSDMSRRSDSLQSSCSGTRSGGLGFRRVRSFRITSRGVKTEDLVIKTAAGSANSVQRPLVQPRSNTAVTPPYRVLVLGSRGVGKRVLIRDFLMTEDYLQELGYVVDEEGERSVSILLDGEESKLEFVDLSDHEVDRFITAEKIDAYVVVYSVEDRRSFETAIDRLYEIRHEDGREVAVILVANKTDLVRTRNVLEDEGKAAANTYDCKYIEVSAAIDHKIDELLCGILKQIRLTRERKISRMKKNSSDGSESCCPLRSGHNVLDKIFRRSKHSSRSCENLYV